MAHRDFDAEHVPQPSDRRSNGQTDHGPQPVHIGNLSQIREAFRRLVVRIDPSDLKRKRPLRDHDNIVDQADAVMTLVNNRWMSQANGYATMQKLAKAQAIRGQQALVQLEKKSLPRSALNVRKRRVVCYACGPNTGPNGNAYSKRASSSHSGVVVYSVW